MQSSRRMPVVCLQPAWGPQNPNLKARLRQRQEALSKQRQQKQKQEYEEWERQAAAEAAQRRQEAAEEFRRRQLDVDGRRAQALDTYRAASQQAYQGEQRLNGMLDEIRAGVQARARVRQRAQGNVVPEAYGSAVVRQQRVRTQQAQQAAAAAQFAAPNTSAFSPPGTQMGGMGGSLPPSSSPPSSPSSSSKEWEAFAASQVAGKFGRIAQMVDAVSRSHEGKDPYQPRRPRTRRPAGPVAAAAQQQQAVWQGRRQQPQQQQQQPGWQQQQAQQQPAVSSSLVRMPWADEAAPGASSLDPYQQQSAPGYGSGTVDGSNSSAAAPVRTAWAEVGAASATSAAAARAWGDFASTFDQQQGPGNGSGSSQPGLSGGWAWAEPQQASSSSQAMWGQDPGYPSTRAPGAAVGSQSNTAAAAVADSPAVGDWGGSRDAFGYRSSEAGAAAPGGSGSSGRGGGVGAELPGQREEGADVAVVEVEGRVVARSTVPPEAASLSGGPLGQPSIAWGGSTAGTDVLQSSEYIDW